MHKLVRANEPAIYAPLQVFSAQRFEPLASPSARVKPTNLAATAEPLRLLDSQSLHAAQEDSDGQGTVKKQTAEAIRARH